MPISQNNPLDTVYGDDDAANAIRPGCPLFIKYPQLEASLRAEEHEDVGQRQEFGRFW